MNLNDFIAMCISIIFDFIWWPESEWSIVTSLGFDPLNLRRGCTDGTVSDILWGVARVLGGIVWMDTLATPYQLVKIIFFREDVVGWRDRSSGLIYYPGTYLFIYSLSQCLLLRNVLLIFPWYTFTLAPNKSLFNDF